MNRKEPVTAPERVRAPEPAADHLRRDRLVRRLEGAPVTLICAPSGFGKTDLVSDWARSADQAVAWLNLDGHDTDAAAFAEHLVAALRVAVPGAGAETLAQLRGGRPLLPEDLGRSLDADFRSANGPLTVVLDDYSSLPPGSAHELVDEILRRKPRDVRLVFVARRDPPLPLPELLVSGRACEIRQASLAFTSSEAAEIIQRDTGWSPEPDLVERMVERLGGWPSGIKLLALALTDPAARERVVERLPEGVRRAQYYLCESLFDELAQEDRLRLLRCSMFTEFTPELCALVSDPECDAAGARTLLRGAGTMVAQVEDQPGWFRIRPLFSDFLEDRFQDDLEDERARELHQRAAIGLSEHVRVADAIEHALLGPDPNLAAKILADHRVRLINEGRYSELMGHMSRLPAEVVDSHLDTQLLRVWTAPSEVFHEAVARVEAMLADEEPPERRAEAIRGELRLMQAGNLMSLSLEDPSGVPELVACAEDALKLLPGSFPGARAMAYLYLSQNLQLSGDAALADSVLDRGFAEFASSKGHPLSTVLFARTILHYLEGSLVRVREAALQTLACDSRLPPGLDPWRMQVRRILGLVHYQWNELDAAVEALDHPDVRRYPESMYELARTLQAQGKESEAEAVVARALELGERDSSSSTNAVFARANEALFALGQGRLDPALRWAEGADTESLRPFHSAISCSMIRARILVEARRVETAAPILARLDRAAAEVHLRRHRVEILAIRALLHAAEGDDEGAFAALRDSMGMAANGRFLRVYLDLGEEMSSLLARFPVPEGFEEYVAAIRGAFTKEPIRAADRVRQDLPDPLTERELEVLARMAERLSNKEIAGQLHVSVATVKSHALAIYGKLQVHRRREAVERAILLGILPPS